MSTQYQLLPDPSTARVNGRQYVVQVNAYAADAKLDPANLPEPVYSVTMTGNDSDDDATGLERARLAVEEAHKAAQQEAAEKAALGARLAGFAKPITVTVADLS